MSEMDETLSGAQIRQHRKAKGWTQDQLAEAAGISLRTVQNAEADRTKLQGPNRDAVVAALQVEGDPILTRAQWPSDVQVFLDMMGAFLMAQEESARLQVMREVIASLVPKAQ